jgi:glycosyltransferase involved in cell wall biosynthesis
MGAHGAYLSGGIRVLYEVANGLVERGHLVKILTPLGGEPKWFDLKAEIGKIPRVFDGLEEIKRKIPRSDILIASSNTEANITWIAGQGIPFYYIQCYETTFVGGKEEQMRIEETYRMPLNLICHSEWIKNLLWARFKRGARVVPIGIDLDAFHPTGEKKPKKRKRVLFMYNPNSEVKGSRFGLQALKKIHERMPNTEIVIFGMRERPNADFPFTYLREVPEKDLPRLYSSSDLFISSSLLEAFPLPPLEAMACGCAVVASDSLGIREYSEDGKNSLIVPPKDPNAIVDAAVSLLQDDARRETIASEALKKTKEFTWKRTIDRLEEIFLEAIEVSPNLESSTSPWEVVTRVSPEDPWAHYKLGLELLRTGDIPSAEKELNEAVSLKSNFVQAYEALTEICSKRKDGKGYQENLKKAVEGSLEQEDIEPIIKELLVI